VASPWNDGRDSNNRAGDGFADEPDVTDEHLAAFDASFRPPTEALSEQDYRTPQHGGPGFSDVVPQHQPRQWPQGLTYPDMLREPPG
jgi:hypothetical protein